ncbi:MAG: hypothetical protein WCD89_08670 [Anaerocolumna sp.]
MQKKIKRILMALIGVTISGVCVGIFNTVMLGADPFTVFVTGAGNLLGFKYGSIYPVVTGVLLIIVFIIDKHYIGIATIFNLFGVGLTGQLTMNLLVIIFHDEPLWARAIMLLFGLVLLCFGSSLYFTADLGVSAYDAMALILTRKTTVSFRFCRIGTDLICVIIGFIFHATIGIGTVLTAFFMGPVIQWFVDHVAIPFLNGKERLLVTED